MKKILSVFATLALMVSQTLFAQARPIETSPRPPEARPTRAFMPDAVGLLNQLTMGAASGGLGLEAAFAPAQDDTTPPRIVFVPPALFLYPTPAFPDFGIVFGVAFDTEFPYIVYFGAAAAIGSFNVYATDLFTYFDYVEITLPNGELALGIGFFAVGYYTAYYDYYTIYCPCGALDMFAVDFAGNTAIGSAWVIALSF